MSNNKKQKVINNYGQINNWNVSQVTNMKDLFQPTFEFNEDISNWNVSNVTTMEAMFSCAHLFNQPLNDWNVSNVKNMNNTSKFVKATELGIPIVVYNSLDDVILS